MIIKSAEKSNDGYFSCAVCPLDEGCEVNKDCGFVLLCAHRVIVGNLNKKIETLVEENKLLKAQVEK